ncbi:hypothetical protein HK405_001480 [Cladochytrium tenue]|nr:hypothetical protein HK405_001480 [Cladochytrium tenue]
MTVAFMLFYRGTLHPLAFVDRRARLLLRAVPFLAIFPLAYIVVGMFRSIQEDLARTSAAAAAVSSGNPAVTSLPANTTSASPPPPQPTLITLTLAFNGLVLLCVVHFCVFSCTATRAFSRFFKENARCVSLHTNSASDIPTAASSLTPARNSPFVASTATPPHSAGPASAATSSHASATAGPTRSFPVATQSARSRLSTSVVVLADNIYTQVVPAAADRVLAALEPVFRSSTSLDLRQASLDLGPTGDVSPTTPRYSRTDSPPAFPRRSFGHRARSSPPSTTASRPSKLTDSPVADTPPTNNLTPWRPDLRTRPPTPAHTTPPPLLFSPTRLAIDRLCLRVLAAATSAVLAATAAAFAAAAALAASRPAAVVLVNFGATWFN